jgi:hypothetical protein
MLRRVQRSDAERGWKRSGGPEGACSVTVVNVPVQAETIEGGGEFDSINVFWCDISKGVGSITVTSWGNAWTAYFGATGDRTIKDFVRDADVDYLVTKMGMSQVIAHNKKNDKYLGKIIGRVKESLEGHRLTPTGFAHPPRPPQAIVDAINNKLAAVQRAIRAENELRQAEAEAKKQIAAAEGKAKSGNSDSPDSGKGEGGAK